MDLCLAAERKSGMKLSRQRLEHPAMDILGIRMGNGEAGGGRQECKNKREWEIYIRIWKDREMKTEITRIPRDDQMEI